MAKKIVEIKLPKLVKLEKLVANNYNPNIVAKPEMDLLEKSILQNGFCFPIITIYDKIQDKYIIVDGFHRHLIAKKLEMEEIPIVEIHDDIKQRMSATIQFNRAKGTHQIEDMSLIVKELFDLGWDDVKISQQLGMDAEELLRLRQFTGMANLFKDSEYSSSWSIEKEK